MTRQDALAYVLTLASNNLACPYGLSKTPDFREVAADMPTQFFLKYEQWLEENDFIRDIY